MGDPAASETGSEGQGDPSVQVRPVALPSEALIKLPFKLYADDPQWVPPLLMDRRRFMDPGRNPYFQVADVQAFLATRHGEVVGSITAQVDHGFQEIEPGVGFFGFFEFPDDVAVARALFQAATRWLRERGMTQVRGPLNFNTNHEFGLLVDGFDTPPCIANPHAQPYHGRIYEAIGLERQVDWYAYWLEAGDPPARIARMGRKFLDRHPEVTLRQVELKAYEREVAIFREIYNDAWADNWGHVRLTDAEFQALAGSFKPILDPRLAWIAEVDGEPAAMALTLPDYNQVFKKMNGRLFPLGWLHLLLGRRRIDTLRVFVLGVKRKYQKLPLGIPLYLKIWDEGMKMGARGAEASLITETNTRMRGSLEKLGGQIYKTYRIYEAGL